MLSIAPILLASLSTPAVAGELGVVDVSAEDGAPVIVNGAEEAGFPQVVALGAEFGDQTFSACTGSLITPRVILTAAHCGEEIPLELIVAAGKAFFGPDVGGPDFVVGFEDMAIHPDYVPLENGVGGTLGEYDVAVLVLAEEVTEVEPFRINPDAFSEEDVGLEMTSIGFGITSPSGAGSGTKRSATLTLDAVDEMFLYSDSDTNPGEGQICSGDSGGPQVAQLDDSGEYVQVAVHSWGDTQCRIQSGSTRVDVAWDFIIGEIEAVHGTDDLCEINGRYGDGTCDDWCDAVDPDCEALTDDGETDDPKKGCAAAAAPAALTLALPGLLLAGLRRRR